jgi:hypothetical protein
VSNTASRALRARADAAEQRVAKAVARRDGTPIPEPKVAPATPAARRLRPTELACGWCAQPIAVKATGRIPRWCSTACRHRAWEQNRAAASGRSGIQIIERIVEVEAPAPTVRAAEAPPPLPRGSGWDNVLHELARQLDTGRIYDRDLPDVTHALTAVTEALGRRRKYRGRR